MLNSSNNTHHVKSFNLTPIMRCGDRWIRRIEIGGDDCNWKQETLFADTREALMLDHEKATEAEKIKPTLTEA